MNNRVFLILLTGSIFFSNVTLLCAQHWQWRDPLNVEQVIGVKQFHAYLIPFGLIGSLLLTDAKGEKKSSMRPGSIFLQSTFSYYRGYQIAGIKNHKTKILEGTIGVGYYFREWLAAGIDFQVAGIWHDNIPTVLAGNRLFVRWHLIYFRRWSLYFEQSVGLVYVKTEFPTVGSNVNFTPAYGLGISFKLSHNIYLIAGASHYHLSNGDIYGPNRNPGFDANGFYLGSHFHF